MSILDNYKTRYVSKKTETMSLDEYLERCKDDKSYYASPAERLLKAIGAPVIIDSSKDERLSNIYGNRKIKTYPQSFGQFFGIESVVEKIVEFLSQASQGLEESKQVLYLKGPVGAAKSSIAEHIKKLMEKEPFYSIQAKVLDPQTNEYKWQVSPYFESPLGLFDASEDGPEITKNFGIHPKYLKYIMSPWAVQILREADGDINCFRVVKMWPSILQQIGITKVEPGDETNQDISALTGKVSINRLGYYEETDPRAYSCTGGLNVTTQGILEFVEMFKASIKLLNPLLTATQEGHYNGTQPFGAIPFQGIILAHSNESEWTKFANDKNNEAFLDRISIIDVPYCVRVREEVKIYDKVISLSELGDAPIAPGTLEMLAEYSILTRLTPVENSSPFLKMEVYDGKNVKSKHPSVKSMEEYRELAGINEGMTGSSTRFAFKALSATFSYDPEEVAANPIHLMAVLTKKIKALALPQNEEDTRLGFIKEILAPKYFEFLQNQLQTAYIDNHDEYCQNLYERYVQYADHWTEDRDFRDPDTNTSYNREKLNQELEKIEKAAGISNPKDFRAEIVKYSLRKQATNGGKMPAWNSYEKIKEVIEKKAFSKTEELIPIISFAKKQTNDQQTKHNQFINRMKDLGYTEKQIKIAVDWYLHYLNNN